MRLMRRGDSLRSIWRAALLKCSQWSQVPQMFFFCDCVSFDLFVIQCNCYYYYFLRCCIKTKKFNSNFAGNGFDTLDTIASSSSSSMRASRSLLAAHDSSVPLSASYAPSTFTSFANTSSSSSTSVFGNGGVSADVLSSSASSSNSQSGLANSRG